MALAALVYQRQQSLIYFPQAETREPADRFTLERIETRDGLELVAGYRAAQSGMPTLLAFHGNAADWQSMATALGPLADAGYGVLAVEYRGYQGNPGKPDEAGLYEDGRAALRWLGARGIADKEVVAVGNSLGSGVAVQLATESGLRALVLVSPVSSMARLASARIRWLPVGLLLTERFDNLAKIGQIACPVLILHGDEDRVIPLAEARLLARRAPNARFEEFDLAGHDLMYRRRIIAPIAAFLEAI